MEKALELWVRVQNRLADDRGQTAAEYMGILFVIAIIIGAVVGAGIHKDIAREAKELVGTISDGGKK